MKYSIIYADPPWAYNDRREIRRDGKMAKRGFGSANLYDVMTIDEIAALPVGDLAADNSALFMWATWPQLDQQLGVLKAWGFKYVGAGYIWLKRNLRDERNPWFGVGYYTKSNTEPCLLGIRGRMKPVSNSISEVIVEPEVIIEPHPRDERGKIIHSRKPAIVREKIVQLFGDLPRVELFSREIVPGWDVWGNEVESTVQMPLVLPLDWGGKRQGKEVA
ncbi:MAG: MT-A70 family methyltransferase [Candidatus Xenobiia bacterium LiM19]